MQEVKYKTGFLQTTVCTYIIYEDVVAVESVSGYAEKWRVLGADKTGKVFW